MIRLIKSTFYKEKETKKKLTKFVLGAKHLSFGKECLRFEENFARWQRRKYFVFVNSGSSANLALIQALLNLGKLKKGDNVGFSALTWSTSVMPLIQLGLNPIPVDVELTTLNVSSANLERVLKKYRLKALFLTNLLGLCSDIDKITKLCRKNKILLFEDNCESLGTKFKGKLLGNYGLASTFSFYVGHHMSTIEGGGIATDDEKLATMLKIVRAHGWDRNLLEVDQRVLRNKHKVNSTFYSRYTFYDLGFNLRPTEINGYLGNIQLKYLNEITKKRNKNFLTIARVLYKNPNYFPIKYDHIDFVSSFAIPVICKTSKIRNELVAKCNGRLEIRPIVGGDITAQPFFKKYVKKLNVDTSSAKIIHEQGLYFGNNPELSKSEIKSILKIVNS